MKKFNMKKTTAAAVAAAVGAVLLLGGAGTLAYWSDTDSSAAQVISSGTLDLGTMATSTEAWYPVVGTTVGTTPVTKIVPGDVVQMTTLVPVTLAGENLRAKLKVTRTADSVATPFSSAITVSTKVGTGTPAVGAAEAVSQELTTTPATGTVPVTITLTFATGGGVSNVDMSLEDASTAIKSMKFVYNYTLEQTRA